MKQPDLARTLEGLAAEGGSLLYEGELAKLMTTDLQLHGEC